MDLILTALIFTLRKYLNKSKIGTPVMPYILAIGILYKTLI